MPQRPTCHLQYAGIPTAAGDVENAAILEASGIVASPSQPGILWTHNDSGDVPRIFAIGPRGEDLAEVAITDAPMQDLEDIAAAPCPDGSGPCLWLADTGNNRLDRDDLAIYVVAEPTLNKDAAGRQNLSARATWRFAVEYPDDAINSEALLVAPDVTAMWLFEKVDGPVARIYERMAPFDETSWIEVDRLNSPGVAALPYGRMITGADMHPSGTRAVLRTYSGIFEYTFSEGQSPRTLSQTQAAVVTYGPTDEPQGEAIAYDEEGYGLWSLSEVPEGMPRTPLHHFSCGDD